MTESVKRVNVTLPHGQVEQINNLIAQDPDAYPSVSAFVAAAVAERLEDVHAHDMLLSVLHELGSEPTAEDRAWAEHAIEIADQAARNHMTEIGIAA